MAKKSSGTIMLIAILGALFLFFSGGLLAIGGYTVLSANLVDFISNDPKINGPAYLVTLVASGGSDKIVFTLPSGSSPKSDPSVRTKNEFKVYLESTKQECEYRLRESDIKLYKFRIETVYPDIPWVSESDCYNKGGIAYFKLKDPVLGVVIGGACVYAYPVAKIGNTESPRFNFDVLMKITNGKETYEKHINNIDSRSVVFGNGIAYAEWSGNLVSGVSCPDPEKYGTSFVYDYDRKGWHQAFSSDVSKALSLQKYGSPKYAIESCYAVHRDVAQCVKELNGVVDEVLRNGAYFGEVSKDSKGYKVVRAVSEEIQYPVITMRIKADWLGVERLVAKPKIVSVDAPEIQSGLDYRRYVYVTVANIGEYDGSFNVYIKCYPNDYASVDVFTGSQNTGLLKPNQKVQLSFVVSGSVEGAYPKRVRCEAVATDNADPSVKDVKEFYITVKPEIICNEGDTRCVGSAIERCENNKWVFYKSCAYGCEMISPTTAQCKEPLIPIPTPIQECTDGDTKCENGIKYVCENGRWVEAGSCGDQCVDGEIMCEGGIKYECRDGTWVKVGTCDSSEPIPPTPVKEPDYSQIGFVVIGIGVLVLVFALARGKGRRRR